MPHDQIDEMTPMKRHGASVTLPAWAWRVHTVTMILLACALIAGGSAVLHKGIGLLVGMESRLAMLESQRANPLIDHEARLVRLEQSAKEVGGHISSLRTKIDTCDRKLDVLLSKMGQ